MKVTLVHNPKAGAGEHSRGHLMALLRKAGYKPRYATIKEALRRPAILDHGEFVIVAGGDGAVRKAMLALARRSSAKGERVLAVLPIGHANNLAHSLGLEGPLRKIVAGWRHGEARRFDVGLAEGPWGRRAFVEGVGIGLIGRSIQILEAINALEEHTFDSLQHRLHRDHCVYQALAQELVPIRARVRLDRRRPTGGEFVLFEVLNIPRVGPRLHLAPEADPGDGRFDVVMVTDREREHLGQRLAGLLHAARRLPGLRRARAREVTLTLSAGALRIDDQVAWAGELGGKSVTVRITFNTSTVKVLVPKR